MEQTGVDVGMRIVRDDARLAGGDILRDQRAVSRPRDSVQ
jgi:hypothetical protein